MCLPTYEADIYSARICEGTQQTTLFGLVSRSQAVISRELLLDYTKHIHILYIYSDVRARSK